MRLIYKKLKQARLMCNKSQKDLSDYFNWPNPSMISQYEMGKKKRIPEEYFDWLLDEKFDLNSLFDEKQSHIKKLAEQPEIAFATLNEPEGTYAVNNTEIAELKQTIAELKEDKKNLNDLINKLREELNYSKGNTAASA